MLINRRRAPSSEISSEKKIGGHKREDEYAALINGTVIKGTQKGDVRDINQNLHSVKGGKKWQVFLYRYETISNSHFLNILKSCLDAFPEDYDKYLEDRTRCIALREKLVTEIGKEKVKLMSNKDFLAILGDDQNSYVKAKQSLSIATGNVCNKLHDKEFLKKFIQEAMFNNTEVDFLAVKSRSDHKFRVFSRPNVINAFASRMSPGISKAGKVPEDFNVDGQKTILTYEKLPGKNKNIVEIEIRNDSKQHYREVRFNMYSEDALNILLEDSLCSRKAIVYENLHFHGDSKEEIRID